MEEIDQEFRKIDGDDDILHEYQEHPHYRPRYGHQSAARTWKARVSSYKTKRVAPQIATADSTKVYHADYFLNQPDRPLSYVEQFKRDERQRKERLRMQSGAHSISHSRRDGDKPQKTTRVLWNATARRMQAQEVVEYAGASSGRRLNVNAFIDPLSRFAARECLAGTVCEAGAAGPEGSYPCPVGSSCQPGSGAAVPAPQGTSVSEEGSIRGMQCFPGQFAPFAQTAECSPCPPGFSCPDFGTITPAICSTGTYRNPSTGDTEVSISCSACPAGTMSFFRGTPDRAGCPPCPPGRVCPQNTGNMSLTVSCPEGHVCASGTSPATQTNNKCPNGFYCGQSITPWTVWKFLCVAGYYCGQG